MKNKFLYTFPLAAALALAGCKANLEKGQLIDPLQNQLLRMEADKANKGKRVSVVGYPAFNSDIKVGIHDEPVLNINSEPDGQGRFLVSFPIPFGKTANHVHVPEVFSPRDILLYDNEGKKHPYNEKMQFSFTLDMQPDRPRITHYPLDERGLPKQDSAIQIYPTYLKDIRIDPAP